MDRKFYKFHANDVIRRELHEEAGNNDVGKGGGGGRKAGRIY